MFVVKKYEHNPILIPDRNHYWEEFASFNLCPINYKKTIFGLYRAISAPDRLQEQKHISIIGLSKSKDGLNFFDREPFIIPKEDWEKAGCEDPRVTHFEGMFYIFYTALSKYPFDSTSIKVAVALSKDMKKIEERHLVTPFNAKAMTLFPERVNGKIIVIFSVNTDNPPAKMVIAELDEIEDLWSEKFWDNWKEKMEDYVIDPKRTETDHVEVGAPPIKTKYGWLLIYSHIQNYFSTDNAKKIFGIEAILLDLKDPTKIIGKTGGPILVPEENYELSGFVSNVVFPTGALLKKDVLTIYYGAADTTTCCAFININDLIFSIHYDFKHNYSFKRFIGNPIIMPNKENNWESKATFNPAAIMLRGKTCLVYRALSDDDTSTLGYALLKDDTTVLERFSYPIYVPREDFEIKKRPGNSGCEDPRLVKIDKNIYMCYTAYDGIGPPRVAITHIAEKDFIAHNWNWEKPFLITPQDVDDKDACILPKKFKEGYFILHRVGNEICGDYMTTLDFKHEVVNKCIRIIGPRKNTWDSAKVGISSPPIETKYGWLLLYHGVSESHSTYRTGFLLLDKKDPAIVLARSSDPIFEPQEQYEKVGVVNNVVFPCGIISKGNLLYIYYGGGDRVIGVASMKLSVILKALKNGTKY